MGEGRAGTSEDAAEGRCFPRLSLLLCTAQDLILERHHQQERGPSHKSLIKKTNHRVDCVMEASLSGASFVTSPAVPGDRTLPGTAARCPCCSLSSSTFGPVPLHRPSLLHWAHGSSARQRRLFPDRKLSENSDHVPECIKRGTEVGKVPAQALAVP